MGQYYKTLTDIEDKLISTKNSGLRILIDRNGLDLFNKDKDVSELIKFSIVCLQDKRAKPPLSKPEFPVFDPKEKDEVKCDEILERLWQTPWPDDLLFTSLNIKRFNGLNKNSDKITLVPFRIDDLIRENIEDSGLFFNFYKLDDDPKTGITYLKTVNRILCKRIPYNGIIDDPIINYLGYTNENAYVGPEKYYKPNHFKSLLDLLNKRKKMILTGFGMGVDCTAIKLLKEISKTTKIFEIRIYAKEKLQDFIDDYESGNLLCTSVILRDIFDPYYKSYNDKGECDFANCEFITTLKSKNPTKKKNLNVRAIPSSEIAIKIAADGALEKIFSQSQILDYFDGASGNFLIMTSQFDADPSTSQFYDKKFKDQELYGIITKKLDQFSKGFLSYDKETKTYEIFFDELIAEITQLAGEKLEDSEINKIENLFKSFTYYGQSETLDNRLLRIAFAELFKKHLVEKWESYFNNRGFSAGTLASFISSLEKEMDEIKELYTYYYKFLHQ